MIVDENDSEKDMLCHKAVNSEQHIVSSDLIFKYLILNADSDLCALILELMDTLSLVRDENIEENVNIHSSESSSSMLSHNSADSIMTEIEQDTIVIFDAVTSSEMNLNVFITRNKTTMYELSSSSKLIISIKDIKKHVKLKAATVSNKMQHHEFETQLNSIKLRNEIKDILLKSWTFSTIKKSLCSELDSELESVINEAVKEDLSNVKNDAEISVSMSKKWVWFMTSYRALLTSLTDWCETYSEL